MSPKSLKSQEASSSSPAGPFSEILIPSLIGHSRMWGNGSPPMTERPHAVNYDASVDWPLRPRRRLTADM